MKEGMYFVMGFSTGFTFGLVFEHAMIWLSHASLVP